MAKLTLIPAAYIFLEREGGKYLFMRRANTGYQDGNYQTPSGHVEEGETAREAAACEAKEEVGVDIDLEDLEFVHAMYRMHDDKTGYRLDLSFRARKWKGEPHNAETHKCDDLAWFSPDELPENTTPYMRIILEDMKNGVPYSETIF